MNRSVVASFVRRRSSFVVCRPAFVVRRIFGSVRFGSVRFGVRSRPRLFWRVVCVALGLLPLLVSTYP